MNKYVYGVDIGGTNIKIGLFTVEPFKKIKTVEIPTPKKNQRKAIFKDITKVIKSLNDEFIIDDFKGIGLTVPCPVLEGVTGLCPNVDLSDLDVTKALKSAFKGNYTVSVSNDANMAAFGEYKHLSGNLDNVAFYTLGTGVGGGLIVNGQLIEGINGTGGEFGHMSIYQDSNVLCGCGKFGCLEQYSGAKGILRIANNYRKFRTTLIDKEDLTIKEIFDAAKMQDEVAINVVDDAIEALAISASILAVTVNPEMFIIGGGIANAGSFLIDKLTEKYKEVARFNTKDTPFVIAKLKNDAGIHGAAHYVYEKYKNELDSL